MSRFFAGGSSDSESSSSDEDLYGSSEEESEHSEEESEENEEEDSSEEDSDNEATGPNKFLKNRFLKGGRDDDSESSEDESKRVVKSAKDKLLDEVDLSIKAIDNAKKINDWVAISQEFDKLNKHVERAIKQYQTTPKRYIKAIAELEDVLTEAVSAEKTSKKKMNASNAKALNTVKQRLKKNNREHEDLIAKFREDPEAFEREQEEEDENAKAVAEKASSKSKINLSRVAAEDNADEQDDEGFATVGKSGKVLQYTPESVFKTLTGIMETRGKKNTDRVEQIRVLELLYKVASGPYQLINVLLLLIPLRFDLASGSQSVSTVQWKAAERDIESLFTILEQDTSSYRVSETAAEVEDLEAGPVAGPDGVKEIRGSVTSLIERLDDELTRTLQIIDPHTTEYVDRLRDEGDLYKLILRAQIYLESNIKQESDFASSDPLSRLLVRRLDHIYFKPKPVIITAEINAWAGIPEGIDSRLTPKITASSTLADDYTVDLLNRICSVLYKQPNNIFRTKAMLSHIYHYALNDQYYRARDMLLMSHLQSSIHNAEPSVQVLFNRALVQIGLCAFRNGLIAEAQQSLQEISSSSRLKELLGQGMTKQHGPNGLVIVPDRQRLLPFHMHINLELLECVYLTSSLLIEIPYMASFSSSIDAKKKIISKPFRRMLDYHDRQVFTGPPENTRDHIMQAARALLAGNWTQARSLLISIKIWNLFSASDDIKIMLTSKLQVEGLRTYLFTFGSCYESLSLATLASLFELPERRISAIVSKMIANEEIAAALDQKTKSVVFRQGVELSKLQSLAQALADKAVQLVERNERLAAGGHQLNDKDTKNQPNRQGGRTGGGAGDRRQQGNQQRAVRA